jgi:hypothetical protein
MGMIINSRWVGQLVVCVSLQFTIIQSRYLTLQI